MLRQPGALLALGLAFGFLACAAADEAASDAVPPETTHNDATAGFSMPRFTRAFGESFMVILATEVGDRTFFIAAIMAMRHSRLVIWSGAAAALVVMTVLSTLVGHVAPLLISRTYTQYAAAALFLFFGVKMLRDGLGVTHAGASEELEEVEAELTKKQEDPTPDDVEGGAVNASQEAPAKEEPLNKIMMQAFTLTFLAEWGDRSQIATIALAAAREPIGVTIGASLGHMLCTGLAVIGGKLLASRISERTVLLSGGGLFCLFSLLALLGIGD
jgi:putative Ca2+/H+ antiporter (TMEM165/GDT1 family)